MSKGLRRMFEQQQVHDELTARARSFKDDASHLRDIEQRLRGLLLGELSDEWVQRPDGNFESKLAREKSE